MVGFIHFDKNNNNNFLSILDINMKSTLKWKKSQLFYLLLTPLT